MEGINSICRLVCEVAAVAVVGLVPMVALTLVRWEGMVFQVEVEAEGVEPPEPPPRPDDRQPPLPRFCWSWVC